jgi:hypothetical protein
MPPKRRRTRRKRMSVRKRKTMGRKSSVYILPDGQRVTKSQQLAYIQQQQALEQQQQQQKPTVVGNIVQAAEFGFGADIGANIGEDLIDDI